MDLNSHEKFLSNIEFLQKENDALKKEQVATLKKLEFAEAKENQMFEHQIEMAKMIFKLDKIRQDDKAKISRLESEFDALKELYRQQILHQNNLKEAINDASVQMAVFKKQKEEESNEAKAKISKLESEFAALKQLYRQQIVHQNKLQAKIAKNEADHEISTEELLKTIKNLKQKYEDLKNDIQAKNSVKLPKDPFLTEEAWCKLKWGQNDENIFLGDVTKFRLNPADIQTAQNFHQPLAYHLNWWLKLNKTETGRLFLKKPEIIKYRNDVCLAINRRFRECMDPWLLKPLRQN